MQADPRPELLPGALAHHIRWMLDDPRSARTFSGLVELAEGDCICEACSVCGEIFPDGTCGEEDLLWGECDGYICLACDAREAIGAT